MESWRTVWRDGFAKVLPTAGLMALRDALRDNDPALVQHATTYPLWDDATKADRVEAACVVGYCGWVGTNLTVVDEVHEFFGRACFEADQLLGEVAACRWFLNFVDDTPRDELRRELLAEVERALSERAAEAA